MTDRTEPTPEVRCGHCDRVIECCWLCEQAGCDHPACYRCVRDGLGQPTDAIGSSVHRHG